jgi:peptidoglycan hydrolase-like protein with peptidoglycan-binding domain
VGTLSPTDGATGVSATANLVITFDAAVATSTGNISIYKTSDNSLIEAINVAGGQVGGGGTNTITINPSVTLEGSTSYYVHVATTAFDDVAGNSYAGITDTTTWNFTTVDTGNPAVSSLSPLDGASDVSITSNLVITFDEAVDAESGDITLYASEGSVLVEAFDVTSSITGTGTTIITVNPTSDLNYATSYYVQVAATAFDDTAGNSYAGITDTTTWNFTTESEPATSESSSSNGRTQKQKILSSINRYIAKSDLVSLSELVEAHKERILRYQETGTRLPAEVKALLSAVEKTTDVSDGTPSVSSAPARDLSLSMEGEDVRKLQLFLIKQGTGNAARELARVGATGYFGLYTKNALGEFQKTVGVLPFAGYFGPITRTHVSKNFVSEMWWQ